MFKYVKGSLTEKELKIFGDRRNDLDGMGDFIDFLALLWSFCSPLKRGPFFHLCNWIGQ